MAKTENPAAPHFSISEVRKEYKRQDFIRDLTKVAKKNPQRPKA